VAMAPAPLSWLSTAMQLVDPQHAMPARWMLWLVCG
jgi:hypothetical protein